MHTGARIAYASYKTRPRVALYLDAARRRRRADVIQVLKVVISYSIFDFFACYVVERCDSNPVCMVLSEVGIETFV